MLLRRIALVVAVAVLWHPTAGAHNPKPAVRQPILIETDLGLDDAVTLALALQAPHFDIAGVLTVAGAASSETAYHVAATLIDRFNRADVPLWRGASANPAAGNPEIRRRLEHIYETVAPNTDSDGRTHSAGISGPFSAPTTVLALGPLTGTAAALKGNVHLARIVIAGPPDPAANSNLAADQASWETVRDSGVPLVFVVPDEAALKPGHWEMAPGLGGGRQTSAAQLFTSELFSDHATRDHYLHSLERLYDELALAYLLHPEFFVSDGPNSVRVGNRAGVIAALENVLHRGRQPKDRVVFAAEPLPDSVLQQDVRARRNDIVANNGEDEWFAQLLLNEVHEHLGAYSIIGVKMGLRAAELLNAPPHTMEVESAAPLRPPVSCLNDGLLMATGSTPGRGLFHQKPDDAVRATFRANGRQVTLTLREIYRQEIAHQIRDLVATCGLEDPAYWVGVRRFGLEIWQDWHRLDLFDVIGPAPAVDPKEPGES